jgi:hypothetical protein
MGRISRLFVRGTAGRFEKVLFNSVRFGRTIMLLVVRSTILGPGQGAAALQYASEMAKFTTEKTGVECKLGVAVGGNPKAIAWWQQYENLAAYEQVWQKMAGDKKYWEMFEKMSAFTVPGASRDEIFKTLG